MKGLYLQGVCLLFARKMVEHVLDRLVSLFSDANANFKLLSHQTSGKSSASVAAIRGTELGQGAKALVCHVKGNGIKMYVLAVLPADQQADLAKLAQAFGARRASLASPAEVSELTGCVFGAIPPVSFHPQLKLVADPMLFRRYDQLAFNAGQLDHSIIIDTKDYQRIVQPEPVEFIKTDPNLSTIAQ